MSRLTLIVGERTGERRVRRHQGGTGGEGSRGAHEVAGQRPSVSQRDQRGDDGGGGDGGGGGVFPHRVREPLVQTQLRRGGHLVRRKCFPVASGFLGASGSLAAIGFFAALGFVEFPGFVASKCGLLVLLLCFPQNGRSRDAATCLDFERGEVNGGVKVRIPGTLRRGVLRNLGEKTPTTVPRLSRASRRQGRGFFCRPTLDCIRVDNKS